MIKQLTITPLCIFFILSIGLSGTIVYGDTPVSGNITTDTTWSKSNSPYIVTGIVQVYPNVTLTIEAGVIIKFNSQAGLKIGGQLIARGTNNDPIGFTANTSSPMQGFWDKIEFAAGSVGTLFDSNDNYLSGSVIENCIIEYNNGVETINTYSNVFISNTTFKSSALNLSLEFTNEYYGYAFINIKNNYLINSSVTASLVAPNGPGRINISNNQFVNSSITAYLSSAGDLQILNNQVTEGNMLARLSAIPWDAGNLQVMNNQVTGGNILASCYGASYVSGNVVKTGDIELQGDGKIYDNEVLGGSLRSTDSRTRVDIFENFISGGNLDVLSVRSTINITENMIVQGGGIKYAYYLGQNGISVNRNDIYDNLPYDLYNDSPVEIDASNNWWGSTDIAMIQQHIYDYYDNFTKGKVIVSPIASTSVFSSYVAGDGICGGKSPCSSSIQNGVDAAGIFGTLYITEETYDENVVLDNPKILLVKGGWDSTFTSNLSDTVIHGSLTISGGTVIVENIILQ